MSGGQPTPYTNKHFQLPQLNPMYPDYPHNPAMSSIAQRSQGIENNYKNNVLDRGYHANNLLAPKQVPAEDYNTAYSDKPLHPRGHEWDFKFSDEYPLDKQVSHYPNILIRKKRFWFSDRLKSGSSDTVEDFTLIFDNPLKDIRFVKIVTVACDYTPVATTIRNAFVYFPNLNNTELTSNSQRYHAYFPVVQGTVGTPVIFNYNFKDSYLTEFKLLDKLNNKFRIQVFRENDTTGDLVAFTELDRFSVELEFNYVDSHSTKYEKDVRPT